MRPFRQILSALSLLLALPAFAQMPTTPCPPMDKNGLGYVPTFMWVKAMRFSESKASPDYHRRSVTATFRWDAELDAEGNVKPNFFEPGGYPIVPLQDQGRWKTFRRLNTAGTAGTSVDNRYVATYEFRVSFDNSTGWAFATGVKGGSWATDLPEPYLSRHKSLGKETSIGIGTTRAHKLRYGQPKTWWAEAEYVSKNDGTADRSAPVPSKMKVSHIRGENVPDARQVNWSVAECQGVGNYIETLPMEFGIKAPVPCVMMTHGWYDKALDAFRFDLAKRPRQTKEGAPSRVLSGDITLADVLTTWFPVGVGDQKTLASLRLHNELLTRGPSVDLCNMT